MTLLKGFIEPNPPSSYLCTRNICYLMKSLLKFTLLSALIISGKLAKQPAPVATAKAVEFTTAPDTSVVLVHQVLTSEPVKPSRQQPQPQQGGSGLIAEMF
jgi:hypothetical protein